MITNTLAAVQTPALLLTSYLYPVFRICQYFLPQSANPITDPDPNPTSSFFVSIEKNWLSNRKVANHLLFFYFF